MGEVVIGISGASGAIYGKRLAEVLNDMGKTGRLVVTDSGKITLKHECDTTPEGLSMHQLSWLRLLDVTQIETKMTVKMTGAEPSSSKDFFL